MNTRAPRLASLLLWALAFVAFATHAATNELSSALQTGLFEEEANRNLPAAMEAYEKVAKQFDQNRALAATAIFRLGEVNRKLGKTNEAAAFYQRILREFSDQDTLAKLSQQNLVGMGVTSENAPSAASGKGYSYVVQAGDTLSKIVAGYRAAGVDLSAESVLAANPGLNATRLRIGQTLFIPAEPNARAADVADLAALHAAEAEVATLGAEVERLKAMSPEDRRRTIEQNYATPVLTKLLQDLATDEQRLVVLSKNYSPNHPEVVNEKALVDTIRKQIDTQLGNVLIGLQEKRFAAAARMKVLREQMDQSAIAQSVKPGNTSPITTVQDDARRLAQQMAAIEELKADPEKQARTVQAMFPDDDLKKMLLHLPKLQEQEAVFKANASTNVGRFAIALTAGGRDLVDFGVNQPAPGLKEAKVELQKQLQYISERVNFILGLQKERLQFLQSLAANEVSGNAAKAPITTVPDEEEAEIRRIQAMIQNSPDLINAPSVNGLGGDTPLAIAAIKGQLRVAGFLLYNGAQVDQPTSASGRELFLVQGTPLHLAASGGHRAMVELLLKHGADVNARSKEGYTALHVAAVKGFQAVAEALLNGKADINAVDKARCTPLHQAARFGYSELVRYLISKGADVDAVASGGSTALMLAADQGDLAAEKELLAGKAKPDIQSDQGRTALSHAAEGGHFDCVEALLAAKADPNAGKADLPLFGAIKARSPDIVEALLKAGADANQVGRTTWQIRAAGGYYPQGLDRVTPLGLAMNDPRLDIVKLLLASRADPNGRQLNSNLPLIFSAVTDAELTKAFLDAGANPNAEDNATEPRTPLTLATDPKVIKLLLAAGAKPEARFGGGTPLISAVARKDRAAAAALLEGGAQVNARSTDGRTPLHFAVQNNDSEMIALLLAHKADVNARDQQGLTPLDYAEGKAPPAGNTLGGPIALPMPGVNYTVKGPDSARSETNSIADLLRQHGGLANLPNMDRIMVSRPAANYAQAVFFRGTNGWNRFTLLDALYNHYAPATSAAPGSSTFQDRLRNIIAGSTAREPRFPDLHHLTIVRPNPKTGQPAARIQVNLYNATNAIDCAKDVPLEFGDTIEIPERLHSLEEAPVGLTTAELTAIAECRKGTVSLVFQARKTPLTVGGYREVALIGSILGSDAARRVLLSTADLTRVKVTRRESENGQPQVWTVDCSNPNQPPDLWLRDGDVVEVPEK